MHVVICIFSITYDRIDLTMDIFSMIFVVLGLCVFEIVSSIDNAVVNADVLVTMGKKARRWFLVWGILIAVFLVRGLLPWFIVWIANPKLGPIGSLTATFSNDPAILESVERTAPMLLLAGGVFLVLLFLHWLFLEEKTFGFKFEKFIASKAVWFFALTSVILSTVVWLALKRDPVLAFTATIGSTAFFIVYGFKEQAVKAEESLKKSHLSDISKLLYLEILDATFSIDGVVGAFAFTLSVPLIILGNSLGAIIVRQFTIKGVDKIRKYHYLKNGAMYSVGVLGALMVLESFGLDFPTYASPLITFLVIGFFLWKSIRHNKMQQKAGSLA